MFSKGDEQEITVELEPVAKERETYNMEFFYLYELETLTKRKLSEEIVE
jgi:hypothetical protein